MKAFAAVLAVTVMGIAPAAIAQDTRVVGITVGLAHSPDRSSTPVRVTDANGVALLFDVERGVNFAYVADRSQLKVPVTMRMEWGRTSLTSAPILPGTGRGYATYSDGHRVFVTVRAGTGVVKVTLASAK